MREVHDGVMDLLVLGGTGWLSGEVARGAVARGHRVTCLSRGAAVPTGAEHVRADRRDAHALDPVAARRWDAVVDVASQPGFVRRAARALESSAGWYGYVSSVSAYADHAVPGADEDAALLPPLRADETASPEEYGAAKAACEAAVTEAFGAGRRFVVRPGLIGGPGDPTGRTTYWPRRLTRNAEAGRLTLVPDAPDLPTAVIDVRDLAAWIVACAERGLAGVFDALGVLTPLAGHLRAAAGVGPGEPWPDGVVPAPQEWLQGRGVAQWVGPRSLPLWIADPSMRAMNARSTLRAEAAGLGRRPLARTLADAAREAEARGRAVADGAGLDDAEEAGLLSALRARP